MDKKQNFSLLRIGFTIGLFLIVLLCILFMRSTAFSDAQVKENSPNIQSVAIERVQYQDSYVYERYFIGEVEARQTSELGFEIAGTVNFMPFDEGDEVKANDVLARLDTARLDADKKEVKANLAVAKANAKLAATTYRRFFTAERANAVTVQEKDEAREARDVTKAAEAVAEAQFESILVDISKTKLLAPFDGVVVKRMVDLGGVVSQGQPILEIQQNANFDVRVGVTSDIANKLELGAKQSVFINGKTYPAFVKAILPVRSEARTIDVILELNQQNTQLRSGDIARVPMKYTARKRGFWVPLNSLVEGRRGLWSLYVLDDEASAVERRTVEIHYTSNMAAFVFGAVNAGESIVTDGASKLVVGQQVQIVKVASNEN